MCLGIVLRTSLHVVGYVHTYGDAAARWQQFDHVFSYVHLVICRSSCTDHCVGIPFALVLHICSSSSPSRRRYIYLLSSPSLRLSVPFYYMCTAYVPMCDVLCVLTFRHQPLWLECTFVSIEYYAIGSCRDVRFTSGPIYQRCNWTFERNFVQSAV